ncbi:UNVERIFIED_ORG: putative dehydrogenase [Arthrobacter globiformis]|nr:putative dehydrogenase [Arthrobacter globiformis]
MKELNVAIVGGGGFMGYAHSMGWSLAPVAAETGAKLNKKLVVEADDERARSTAERYGWDEYTTNWRDVITRDDIDIVDIVTPPAAHAEVAIAALAAGKHVFVEKPISNDLTEALQMAEAAERSGVVHQVGFNYRYTPAMRFIKRMIEDGTLGHPLQFRGHYLQDNAILGRTLSGWRANRSAGGSGVVGDIGSHLIDLAQYLAGDITKVNAVVRAKNPAEDTGWLTNQERLDGDLLDDAALWMGQFESGAIGSFATTVYASGRKNRLFFELECSKGTVEFDWNRREEVKLSLLSDPADQQGMRTVIMNQTHEDFWWPMGGMGIGYVDGTAIQLQHFVRAIVSNGVAAPGFAEATQVQRVIEAVMISGDKEQWVDVEDSKN